MRLLDLCCGLGGWTRAFMEEGFDCTGVDIINHGYPAKFIQSDIQDFTTKEKFNVITASPPCTEFSIAKYYGYGTQIEYQGLDLVWSCFRIINEIKPRYWILENVKGIANFIGEPKHIVKYNRHHSGKSAYLYGEFPIPGMFENEINFIRDRDAPKWGDPRRSLIPYPMAKAFAREIKNKLSPRKQER